MRPVKLGVPCRACPDEATNGVLIDGEAMYLCSRHTMMVLGYARQLCHTDHANPGSRQQVGRRIWQEAEVRRKRREADQERTDLTRSRRSRRRPANT